MPELEFEIDDDLLYCHEHLTPSPLMPVMSSSTHSSEEEEEVDPYYTFVPYSVCAYGSLAEFQRKMQPQQQSSSCYQQSTTILQLLRLRNTQTVPVVQHPTHLAPHTV